MEGIERRLYAVTLSFVSHSHFNAVLNLSRLLATRCVKVICVTLPSNRQILLPRVQRWGDLPLYFHDLSVPNSPLPPDRQIVNNISGDELPMIFDIIHKMREPLKGFVAELTGREYYESRGFQLPDCLIIIYNMFMGCSTAMSAEFGMQSFMFSPGSTHSWFCLDALCPNKEVVPLFPEIADTIDSLASPDFVMAEIRELLVNTFRELEPKFVGHLECSGRRGKPVRAVGPMVELPRREKIQSPRDADIVEWLDLRTRGSVMYVAFGSESYISSTQIIELVVGLEATGQPFLWMLWCKAPHFIKHVQGNGCTHRSFGRVQASCDETGETPHHGGTGACV